MSALEGRDHELFNVGMKKNGEKPEILYSMRYPGVFCGHILTALDAWLFTQINGGNCISLALNQGYGWAADISLRFIFDRIFSVEQGCGNPPHRKEPQQAARQALEEISSLVHQEFHRNHRNFTRYCDNARPGVSGFYRSSGRCFHPRRGIEASLLEEDRLNSNPELL
ncbi:MAG: hypothetical protein V3V57_07335 [Spirochaetia bacterium]